MKKNAIKALSKWLDDGFNTYDEGLTSTILGYTKKYKNLDF